MTKLKLGPLPAADPARLILPMLEWFMATDRGVQRPGGRFHRTESGYFFDHNSIAACRKAIGPKSDISGSRHW
ncbi:DUF2274 domain-containing protein [Bordetella bronchiseptica]|jgi:hypothetical protein|uniref:DUF2274 domain-containing protein n=1 Tax=Bordetella bronchiseptica TaxID=518 RepID=UPI000DE23919|nr:DUF2274 domain-containing protein [Bordetella bronchiseptica]